MKKKNKGKNKDFIGGILIIVGILLVILIFFFLIPAFQEPHFKIYKEECRNESNWHEEFITLKLSNTTYFCSGELIQFKTFNKSKFDDYNERGACSSIAIEEEPYERIIESNMINIPQEICELIEVDEIKICHEEEGYCPKTSGGCMNIPKCECPLFIETISKQDLSIGWLEENCGCTDIKRNYERGCSNCDYSMENIEEEGITWWNKEEHTCVKYKCEFDETYFVENWNQIK